MTTYIFGDSFVGPFNLINDQNVKIYKFTGATMKGIRKRTEIIDILNYDKRPKCIIFSFGQVDLYFSYYYVKFLKNKKFMMKSIIKNYVEFVNSLECNNCNKIIFSVYPTTLKDTDVFKALIKYNILSEDVVNSISKSDKEKTSNFRFRFKMYTKFNKLLSEYCQLYKINCINLDNELLDKNKQLKPIYINYKYISVHLVWESIILVLINRISCCNIQTKYKQNLTKSLKLYLQSSKHKYTNYIK